LLKSRCIVKKKNVSNYNSWAFWDKHNKATTIYTIQTFGQWKHLPIMYNLWAFCLHCGYSIIFLCVTLKLNKDIQTVVIKWIKKAIDLKKTRYNEAWAISIVCVLIFKILLSCFLRTLCNTIKSCPIISLILKRNYLKDDNFVVLRSNITINYLRMPTNYIFWRRK